LQRKDEYKTAKNKTNTRATTQNKEGKTEAFKLIEMQTRVSKKYLSIYKVHQQQRHIQLQDSGWSSIAPVQGRNKSNGGFYNRVAV
jgi:hypothetical protein